MTSLHVDYEMFAIQGYGCKLVHFQLLSCLGPRNSVLFIEVESAFRGSTVARSCDFSVKKKKQHLSN